MWLMRLFRKNEWFFIVTDTQQNTSKSKIKSHRLMKIMSRNELGTWIDLFIELAKTRIKLTGKNSRRRGSQRVSNFESPVFKFCTPQCEHNFNTNSSTNSQFEIWYPLGKYSNCQVSSTVGTYFLINQFQFNKFSIFFFFCLWART